MDRLLIVTVFGKISPIGHNLHMGHLHLVRCPANILFQRDVTLWDCDRHTLMGFHQISDTHGKQGNLQQSNLLHWTETSVHLVSKGPNAATCQSTPASLPNNQSKDALHLGNLCYCEVSETSSACLVVPVSLNQETAGSGGLVSVDSTEDSSVSASSSVASPWPDNTSKDTKINRAQHAAALPALLPHNVQHLCLWVQIWEVHH